MADIASPSKGKDKEEKAFRTAIFNTQPPHLYVGGVERRIMEMGRRLVKEADVTVYSGTKAGFREPTKVYDMDFIPCHSTDRVFPLDNWTFNRSIIKMTNKFDDDIFEAHTVSAYGLPRALKRQGIKKPFIQVVHGVLAEEYEQAKKEGYTTFRSRVANYFMSHLARLEMQTAQEATLVVTISRYSLQKMETRYRIDPKKVRIVPNGVDIEKFQPMPDQAAAKREFSLSKDPYVLFIGSLIPRKGLPFLIEAAKRIVQEKKETKFLIVGDGPQRKELDLLIQAMGLTGNFFFMKNVPNFKLAALYNSADVFVLPSIQEGQGIVLLEAQACGRPVVAFDIGGVNEAVLNNRTGLLVRQGSYELAESILRLLADKSLQKTMGDAGRKLVTEDFTWDICAQKMLKVYHEALGK